MTSAAGGLPGLPGVNTVLWDLDGTLVGIRRRTFAALMPAVAAAMFADIVAPWRFARILAAVLPDVRANTTELTNFDLMVTRIADETGRDPELIGAQHGGFRAGGGASTRTGLPVRSWRHWRLAI